MSAAKDQKFDELAVVKLAAMDAIVEKAGGVAATLPFDAIHAIEHHKRPPRF